jgi:ABC-2 type transport system permease protein
MSVTTVARKDLADAGRSKMLWAVVILVVLSTAGITGLLAVSTDEAAPQVFTLGFQLGIVTLPIIALLLAKGAITGERDSGSLRLLLSLPPARRDVLLGKLVGRTVLMLIATLIGGLATALVVVVLLGSGVALVGPFIGLLGLMGVAFVGLGIGISAASASDSRATAVAVGAYMLLVALWNLLYSGIQRAAAAVGVADGAAQPVWLDLIGVVPPNRAAAAAFDAVVSGRTFTVDPIGSLWLPVVIMLAWVVIPAAIGYRRFNAADLG